MARLTPESTPAEVRVAWVAALRSGCHRQIAGRLQTDEGCCGMGVLCSLAVQAMVIPPPTRLKKGARVFAESQILLPEAVKTWAGLRTRAGGYYHHTPANLVDDNDERGHSFNQLAETIESEPEGLLDEGWGGNDLSGGKAR